MHVSSSRARLRVLLIFLVAGYPLAGCNPPVSTTAVAPAAPSKFSEGQRPAKIAASKVKSKLVDDRLAGLDNVVVKPPPPQDPSPFRFTDIAEQAGIDFRHFSGMTPDKHFPTANGSGVAFFDYDNDGKLDVYFATATLFPVGSVKKGPNKLYRNLGDGKFQDVTGPSGLGYQGFCHGIVVGDVDNDGDQDVFLCNYGPNVLYRNNGDGTFTDVYDQFLVDTAGTKIPGRTDGHGFAAVIADLNGDGKVDIRVTNDMNPAFLYLNKGGGLFEDATETSGQAFDNTGNAQSGMGVDAEDIDGDGDLDLIASNFAFEYNTLHLNLGQGAFADVTPMVGLGADTMPYVGWGIGLVDFNNDGWPDCFVANGHVDDNRQLAGQSTEYAEPALLHVNVPNPSGKGRTFRLATRDVGPYFATKHVARGAAFGDFDNDGDMDIVINHKDGAPALLRNDTPTDNHWIRLELVGTKSNRDAVGARVTIELHDGRTIHRQRKGGCSVLSANDPRLTIGVGPHPEIKKLTIDWPSGARTVREQVATNQALKIVEGTP